jgi:endonuclease/exonuclease/phosphatase family metal-dependent hydrolase
LKAPPLRILTYNVRYFGHALKGLASTRASERAIASRIAALDPISDVVCLQEIETISLRSRLAYRRPRPEETQFEAFMAEMERAFRRRGHSFPYDGFYFRAHTHHIRNVPITTAGLAILVNTRRLKVESHNAESPHPITHHHVEMLKDRKQARICAHVRVRDRSGRSLHVFNTHLSLPTPFARAFWRAGGRMGWGVNQLHEARTLAGFVRRRAGADPFVVCGDFNSAPGSPVFRYLTRRVGFHSAEAELGLLDADDPRAFPTAGFMRLRMHLDHLFYGGGVSWVDLQGTAPFGDRRSPFAGLSDHVPIIGRLRCIRAEDPSALAPALDGSARAPA